jgi:uncharacterized protein (DUF58 family)
MAVNLPTAPGAWFKRSKQRFWRLAPSDPDSVTLTHNRIYILPTGRGWAFSFTLVLMLLTSMNYALSLGYALTFLFGGLMHAAMLHTFRNLSQLVVEAVGANDAMSAAFAGEAIAFRIALRNPTTWTRHCVRVCSAMSHVATAGVVSENAHTVEIRLRTRERGRISPGRLTLDTDYPLGLWRAWAYVHFPLRGIVYPAPEPSAPAPPAFGHGAGSSADGRGDEEFSSLRAYQPGDPIPRVAWKTAARGLGLFTKEFAGTGSGSARISWWLTPAQFDVEHRLSRLTAWVLLAEQRGQQYSLELPGASLPLGRGDAQRGKALAMLALYDLPQTDATPQT